MNFLRYIVIIFLLILTNLFITWCTLWQTVSKLEDSKDIYSSRSTVQINDNEPKSKLEAKVGEEESEEMRRSKAFERKVISNLRQTVMDNGKKILAGDFENKFQVEFKGDPFFRTKQLDQFFRSSPFLSNKTYNSCAVVTNSGSLINSGHGTFIDSHDLIIRFNDGPTSGFEKDVGSKTSLRVINSKVPSLPEYGFLAPESLYSSSPVLVWDPNNYTASVSEWYSHPYKPFFENFFCKATHETRRTFVSFTSRKSMVHLGLDPISFKMADGSKSNDFWLLGLAIAIQHCSIVRSFEYIPSLRYSNKCHYHGIQTETGEACTFGDWHPVSAEKLMALALNIGKKKEIYSDGFVTIPGFAGLEC
nr:beta-galactoside alpha-2,6-sialyltransferase 2-like [Lepeophtheirus salmonis]